MIGKHFRRPTAIELFQGLMLGTAGGCLYFAFTSMVG